jgi:hypothetical protein
MRALVPLVSCLLIVAACGDSGGGNASNDTDTGTPGGAVGLGGGISGGGTGGEGPAGGSTGTPDAQFIDVGPRGGSGGGGGVAGGGGEQPLGRHLRIEPDDATLLLGIGPAPTQQFRLEWVDADGSEPVPARDALWALLPNDIGDIDADGLFTAGVLPAEGRIEAVVDGERVSARVTLVLLGNVLEPGVPADAPARFAQAPEGQGCGPRWVYPEAGTVIPSNLTGLTLQWNAQGHDLFMVTFHMGGLRLDWYTNQPELTPSGDNWANLLASSIGQEIQMTITGLGGAGDDACASEALPIVVDQSQMTGAVYYWSTGDFGIMRIPIGDSQPEPFLNPAVSPEINCPACHALSRDGQRIALTRTTFPPFGNLFVSAVNEPRMPFYDPGNKIGYFPSFSPASDRLVGGNGGQLTITDVLTGNEIERLPMPMGHVGGSPDWAWQTESIVAAYGDSGLLNPLPDVGISGGAIAQWQKNGDTWSEPEVLVEREGEESNDRPAYSPDGTFIAFQRSGVAQMQGQSMGNASNSLWIIPAAGGAPPVELARANMALNMGNSWPKWAPPVGGGRLWLAFSSFRSYGNKLPQGGAEPRPQLWVTAIDPDAPPGSDPSAPAFWLPGQSIDSGNHIPYWAVYQKQ